MLISELSAASGVSTHLIKFYLREGLLRQGHLTSRTRAEYSDDHLRELVLIRALVDLRGLPVQAVGEILAALRLPATNFHYLLGYLVGSLDEPAPPAEPSEPTGADDEDSTAARRTLDEAVAAMGWHVHPGTKAMRSAEASLDALRRYGIPLDVTDLLQYAQAADTIAQADFAHLSTLASRQEMFEHALIRTFLLDTTVLAMRRLAQEHLSGQHFSGEDTDPAGTPQP
ncbi:MerR family transcriptional regulator [Sanguibacter antarcticus]|uniref:MerR-like DNA binding protein n=1 Tax=Sanguibacter antarcticus TaxID=372484 RepID=A0A2A9E5D3_9MICO|nr:MerR family transcriptional regulator [Sanguibacter antarcticus]PFG34168.1 MerR-like DNA binding protein [Sanguibacter antarcticus]